MAEFTREQFDALWASLSGGPVFKPEVTTPIQVDLSLSAALDRYVANASQSKDHGRIPPADFTALTDAVNALKVVLERINDRQLVADWVAARSTALKQLPPGG